MIVEKTVLATLCFVVREENILMIRKRKSTREESWTVVGGKAKLDEDPNETCVRETREETGLQIYDPRLRCIQIGIDIVGKKKWIIFTYLTDKFDGRMKESSEGEIKWVNFEDIPELNIPARPRLIFSRVLDEKEPLFLFKYICRRGEVAHHKFTDL